MIEYHNQTDCYGCNKALHDLRLAVWLAQHRETPNGRYTEEAWPFHRECADQPWPLYEVAKPPDEFFNAFVD